MKKLRVFLRLFLFAQLGFCAGRVAFNYIDYVQHPAIYEVWSAPWYTRSLITVILTVITATITMVAYFVVGHLIKKRERKENEDK